MVHNGKDSKKYNKNIIKETKKKRNEEKGIMFMNNAMSI